jgi:lipoprotein-anchoring transpeptidase ErfK/SrfK
LALGFVASTLISLHSASAGTELIISVPDQQLAVVRDGLKVATFPVSTSKFGVGDRPSSFSTPIGAMEVAQKIGAGAPAGAVFKHRQYTGEVLRPNTTGRDPIVTRILHLRGLEAKNARAFDRGIYIHGTPEEKKIGRPVSYGCIRMKSSDVIRVFDTATVGTRVEVVNTSLGRALRSSAGESRGSNRAS